MPYSDATELDVDGILERINAELRRRERDQADAVPVNIPRISATPPPLEFRDHYSVAEFMRFHDIDFVLNVHGKLLGRHPGEHYLNALRTGKLSRIEILGRVRYSREARRRGVAVSGLLPQFLLQSAFRVPVLGYVLEMAYAIARLPLILRNLRLMEERTAVADRDLASQINKSITEIETIIGETDQKNAD